MVASKSALGNGIYYALSPASFFLDTPKLQAIAVPSVCPPRKNGAEWDVSGIHGLFSMVACNSALGNEI